jgi:hypothetical protein
MSKPSGGPNMSQAAKRPDGYDDWYILFNY